MEKANQAEQTHFRRVRSFVLRGGRLTEGQKRALDQHWPRFGVDKVDGVLDFSALFANDNPVVVDIGFGKGESTLLMAAADSDSNFLGLEVHPPGVGHLLLNMEQQGIENIRIACEDAVEFVRCHISDSSLQGVCIYFPDPWPKKRHHKRRIVQAEFVALLGEKLVAGGFVHLATDWSPYAEHMMEVLEACGPLHNEAGAGCYIERPPWRAQTKYESRGERLGHEVHDLLFRKRK
jgi:tRNA (guanine-N7-)-methyltransferase